jgi:hypothetical protein
VVPALVVAFGLTGCGSVSDRERGATDAAVTFLDAVAAGDGAAACAVLAPDTLAEMEKSSGEPCAAAVLDEDLPSSAQVETADVYGQWARVVLSTDTVFLAVFPDGWRVVAAGCRSRGERPYDCAVQGG